MLGVEAVLSALNEADPYGLQPGSPAGVPVDEYAREARDIAEILAQQGRVSQDDVDGIWESWFNEPLVDVIGIAGVTALVARMNSLRTVVGRW
ncbi:hypothetical protein [Microbacterium sp. LMI1x-1-1.1]|uniref:hypothetical protein n=1 Tax=Microbacterium sp. LMI1x-1-1.1 TaxID=3135246 RepID=UPI0034483A05